MGEAVLTASYLINRMPSRVLGYNTPLNTLQSFFPLNRSFTNLLPNVFGCTTIVHVHDHKRSKLDPRATKCVFLGFSPTQKGYICFDPISGKMFISMDVTFFENKSFFDKTHLQGENEQCEDQFWETMVLPMPFFDHTRTTDARPAMPIVSTPHKTSETENNSVPPSELRVYSRRKSVKGTDPPLTLALPSSEPSTVPGILPSISPTPFILDPIIESTQSDPKQIESSHSNLDEPIATKKGVRACTKHPISHHVSYNKLSPRFGAFTTSITDDEIPKSIQEALVTPKWREAVLEEIRALHKNETWELTTLPKGKHLVGSKWIFSIKYNSDGTIERYKARLVARGFTQTYGLDYEETFAPVAKLNTVRVLLSLAVNSDWPLLQFDVKNAFLNGDLEEEVFMEIPLGFDNDSTAGKVCR